MAQIIALAGGAALWTTESIESERGIEVQSAYTVVIVPNGKPGQLSIIKLADDLGKPESVFYPWAAIQNVRTSRDKDIDTKCRAALSGLVMA